MPPTSYQLFKNPIVKGASWTLAFRWKTKNSSGLSIPVDLTGCTARLVLKKKNLQDLTYSATIDIPTGKISANLTPVQTAAITIADADYFMEVTHPSGSITTVLYGVVPIK
jgi:hypothetical protein